MSECSYLRTCGFGCPTVVLCGGSSLGFTRQRRGRRRSLSCRDSPCSPSADRAPYEHSFRWERTSFAALSVL